MATRSVSEDVYEEDVILNFDDYDPDDLGEISEIDEDELLGGLAEENTCTSDQKLSDCTHTSDQKLSDCTPASEENQVDAGKVNPAAEVVDDGSLEDSSEELPSTSVQETSLDDDEDDKDSEKTRDKFHSERQTLDNRLSAGGGIGKPIPDTLDDIKVDVPKSAVGRRGRGKFRGGRDPKGKVLLNPFYKGTVTRDPNVSLRWETSHPTVVQLGAVKVKLPRPIVPLVPAVTPFLHVGPPPLSVVNLPPPQMAMPLVSSLPFFPTSAAPPVLVSSSVRVGSSRSNVSCISSAFQIGGAPPPIFSTRPPPLTSYQLPPTVSSVIRPENKDWLSLTEEFLRKAKAPHVSESTQSCYISTSHRQRAAFEVKKKYGLHTSPYGNAGRPERSQRSNSVGSQARGRRKPYENIENGRRTNSVVSDKGKLVAEELGLTDDYLRKVEEQKRLREELNKRKELRRKQDMVKKQAELKQQTPHKENTGEGEVKGSENSCKGDFLISSAPKKVKLSKNVDEDKEVKITDRVGLKRKVQLPKRDVFVRTVDNTVSTVKAEKNRKLTVDPKIAKDRKPEIIVVKKSTTDDKVKSQVLPARNIQLAKGTLEERRERVCAKDGQPLNPGGLKVVPKAQISLVNVASVQTKSKKLKLIAPKDLDLAQSATVGERKPSHPSEMKETGLKKVVADQWKLRSDGPHKSVPIIAAVAKNVASSTSLTRMQLIAGTVGKVKTCLRPEEHKVVIIFENPNDAALYLQRYNRRMLDNSTLEISLEPWNESS